MQVTQILAGKGADVFSILPESTVAHLVTMLNKHRVGALLVQNEAQTVVGIVSERDVVRALSDDPANTTTTVETIMTKDVVTVTPDTDVAELMRLMTERRIRHVPVVDEEGQLLGLVSIGDAVKVRMDELETERAALMDYITQGG
jgi:CBS domain-containing protein